MKVPLSWLEEYINIDLPHQAIAKALTLMGNEVEGVEKKTPPFSGVVVVDVLEVEQHPNADKLSLAIVTDGQETRQVVCGAPNCRVGLKTALAGVGATVVDDKGKAFAVKRAKIRGVESLGMLCSAAELGLSDESEGIIELDAHVKTGADLADYYSDTVFDIAVTPNMGHAASLIGIARELAVVTQKEVQGPQFRLQERGEKRTEELVTLEIEANDLCLRYACRVVEGVKVAPSPEWLQQRLTLAGMRPVNNIVDATNYVMLELGHPLHPFDYDQIAEKRVVVRKSRKGEHLVTLDGKERNLDEGLLVIADAKGPIAVAGVMGGEASEVKEHTTRVLLESAYFLPHAVRKSNKRLGLPSEASRRFERGADPKGVELALNRAADLIAQLTGGAVAKGILSVATEEFVEEKLTCRLSRIHALLGVPISLGEVEAIFSRLNFAPQWDGEDTFTLKVPSYRHDLKLEVDFIEEVARVYGYENLPRKMGAHPSSSIPHAPIYTFEKECRSLLVAQGLQEVLTCDLIGPSLMKLLPGQSELTDSLIQVKNPTSVEQSILRQSLLPGMLQVVKHNYFRQNSTLHVFEIGRIHFRSENKYKEQTVAGILLTGKQRPHAVNPQPSEVDFYDLKGVVEPFLQALGIQNVSFLPLESKTLHPGRQAGIFVDRMEVGALGEVHPAITRALDIPQKIYFAEINLHDLFPFKKETLKMTPLPQHPAMVRDWTLDVKESVPVAEMINAVSVLRSPLLADVFLLDLWCDPKAEKPFKSVTLRFVYRHPEKTLMQEVVDKEHERVKESAEKKLTYAIMERS
ncbi:MAG: phenylalanine--tRNA ligase subunit beta [Chlamydiia bacterium]|nr:phenylalanine--tRNA ligase subunit beta [Chlamydiia bacterium]